MKTKLSIEQTSEVNTYAHLRQANSIVIKLVSAKASGNYYHSLTSLVLSAFTIEGYCNHLGSLIVKNWNDIDRTPIREKISFLCAQISLDLRWGARPWQDVDTVIGFRNLMAHGRTEKVNVNKVIEVGHPDDDDFVNHALTGWQQLLSNETAIRCFESVGTAIEQMHVKSKVDGFPFDLGITQKLTETLP